MRLGIAVVVATTLSACSDRSPVASEQRSAIDLKSYHLAEGPIRLQEIDDNASGLTWDWDSNTLVGIINDPPAIFRMDMSGAVITEPVSLDPLTDTEGVTYTGHARYLVTEERRGRIATIRWESANTVELEERQTLDDMPWAARLNRGLEGIVWNPLDGSIRTVSEASPRSMWHIAAKRDPQTTPRLDGCQGASGLSDWAGLAQVPGTAHFLLLSEESSVVAELDALCRRVDSLDLNGNSGSQSIPQAEGIVVDGQCQIWVLSEPNLLYRFASSKPCKFAMENPHDI